MISHPAILDIIVPIDFTKWSKIRFPRLRNCILHHKIDGVSIIIVDATRQNRVKKKIKDLAYELNCIYIPVKHQQICSPGKLRNIGAQKATSDYLLFLDVDLILHPDLSKNLVTEALSLAESTKKAFRLYPCIYLSKNSTKLFERYKSSLGREFEYIKFSSLKGTANTIEHIALATSTILLSKSYFLSLGGFDEKFFGYGMEDLEFLDRLNYNYNPFGKTPDYCLDYKSKVVANQRGFRAQFSLHSLCNLFENKFSVHLWHPKPLHMLYYRMRKINEIHFHHKLIEKRSNLDAEIETIHFESFIKETQLKYGYALEQYNGLFIEPVIIRSSFEKTFRRIRRFFINHFLENFLKQNIIDTIKSKSIRGN